MDTATRGRTADLMEFALGAAEEGAAVPWSWRAWKARVQQVETPLRWGSLRNSASYKCLSNCFFAFFCGFNCVLSAFCVCNSFM